MKRSFVIVTIVLASLARIATSEAATPVEAYNEGNRHYADGDYAKAILSYEEAVKAGIQDGALFYNLANALVKSDPTQNIGRALVFLERAYALSPWDEDVQNNLRVLRADVSLPSASTEAPSWLSRFFKRVDRLPVGSWLWLHFALFTATFILVFARLLKRPRLFERHPTNWLLISLVAALVGVTAWMAIQMARHEGQREGITLSGGTVLRSGPSEDQADILDLPAGAKFVIVEEREDWLQVRLAAYPQFSSLDGLYGWLPRNALEMIR